MARLRDIFQLLRQRKEMIVDRAMVAALPTADPTAMRLIALSLLERCQPKGTIGLIQHFHRLPPDIQQHLLAQSVHLDQPLREAASREDPMAAINVIEILRRVRAPHLAYLVSEQLRRRTGNTRTLAAQCLLELALCARGSEDCKPTISWSSTELEFLYMTVDDAVVHYASHRQQPILLALAALACRPLTKARTALTDHRHPAVEPMRYLLETADFPEVRQSLLVMMRIPTLVEFAHRGIIVAMRGAGAADVLSQSHLLLDHQTRLALHTGDRAKLLPPDNPSVQQWMCKQAQGLPRWTAAANIDPAIELRMLGGMNGATDPLSRLAALRRLIDLSATKDCPDAVTTIVQFCTDSHEGIARVALRHLIKIKCPGLWHLLPKLINRRDPRVRQIVATLLAPLGFKRFFDAWPRMAPDQQASAGRALIKIDPNFHRLLGKKLSSIDHTQVLRALSVIHRLHQGSLFEPALISLLRHENPVITSAAVIALDSTDSPDAQAAITEALNHQDSRVRANALEALAQVRSTQYLLRLTTMAQNEENRPRANAIQTLINLKFSDAMSALVKMLNDPRPQHRISALWLVRKMALVDMASHVAELSISDPDQSVKNRAGQVVAHLIELLSDTTCKQDHAQMITSVAPQGETDRHQQPVPVLSGPLEQTKLNH